MSPTNLLPWVLIALGVCACAALITISWSISWLVWKEMKTNREKERLRRIEEGYRR